ncbi:hypothetical protein AYR62_14320 [Secundilactobacillus paracollinoides]|uniref:hypothetical protein n=1 Tax=Secundilactobacillus paracollinoides TaxID=240427 RepID=UPI00081A83E2|nr:hypothetical protein [Secundilactobacillus paracollinoides]ANZ65140.1 hypothetical protein AYR62_14320 [Secundilactobacillus paracollinoides]
MWKEAVKGRSVSDSGSIVTKDLPDNVVAVGNPAHVMREVNDHDRAYYFKDRQIDWSKVSVPDQK